jgi:hypothetical protein
MIEEHVGAIDVYRERQETGQRLLDVYWITEHSKVIVQGKVDAVRRQ